MKSYTDLSFRQFKVNKKKYISTIVGCILAILFFTMIFNIKIFDKELSVKDAKVKNGNAEVQFINFDGKKIDNLKSNALVEDFSIVGKNAIVMNVEGEDIKLSLGSIDKNGFEKTFKDSLEGIKGDLPKSSNEMLLSEKGLRTFNKKIGDNLKVGDKEYKIVGSFDSPSNEGEVKAITFDDNLSNFDSMDIFLNTKGKKEKITAIKNVAMDSGIVGEGNFQDKVKINVPLLYSLYGIDSSGNVEKNYSNILIIVFMIVTGFLIYGSISSHMNNRTKEIGILRCIGATPKQIKTLIFREGMMIGVLALVPGIALGYGVFYLYVWILKNFMATDTYGYQATFYPSVIIIVTLITLITLSIVMFASAKKMSNISAIEGIKNSNNGNLGKEKKIKKSKIIRKLFGINGELAYRNIRANNKTFVVTTITLVLSFMIFVGFSTWLKEFNSTLNVGAAKNTSDGLAYIYTEQKIDGDNYSRAFKDLYPLNKEKTDEVKKLMETKGVTDYLSTMYLTVPMIIENATLDKDVNPESATQGVNNTVNVGLGTIAIYDDAAFNKIKDKIQGNDVTLNNFNNGGVILVNGNKVAADLTGKNFDAIKVDGNKLDLKIKNHNIITENPELLTEEEKATTDLNLNIIGKINQGNLVEENRLFRPDGVNFIISRSYVDKNLELLGKINGTVSETIYYNFKDAETMKANQKSIENFVTDKFQGNFLDLHEEKIAAKKFMIGISLMTYGLLAMVCLILVISIINRKSKEMLDRKKEIGALLAIGMDKKDLRNSILLESVIQWAIATVISLPLGILMSKKILDLLQANSAIKVQIPILSIILGIIVLLIILIIAVYIPIRKFNKTSKIDLIRGE